MSDGLPDWVYAPPLTPTERTRFFGLGGRNPSDILSGPTYDVRAHYEHVKQLHGAYPLRTIEQCEQFSIAVVRRILKDNPTPSQKVGQALIGVVGDILETEGVFLPFLHTYNAHSTANYVQLILRPHLAEAEQFYTERHIIIPKIEKSLNDYFRALLLLLPNVAFVEPTPNSTTLPLIQLMPNAAQFLQETIEYFLNTIPEPHPPRSLEKLRNQLIKNFYSASGVDKDTAKNPRLINPVEAAEEHDLSEIVALYFNNTAFPDLFLAPVPFDIPDHPYREEHTHILGASGSGKTTLIQQIVLNDLAKPDPPAMIIIDPKGLLVERIQKLDVFNPETGRLKDRLVIIDPTHSPPPALNLFDPASKRFQMYSDQVRQLIENQTISTYAYVFSSVSSTLTAKQQVGFSFVVRLLFSIPAATIHTLLDLMDDKAKTLSESRFASFVGRLDPTSRRFFENDFYHPTEFRETKAQIKARLFSILVHRSMDAMFSVPERKLDMIDCLQSRKIVLVNTAMGVIGSDGSQLLGRYIITLTLNAAFSRIALPKKDWNFVSLIVDEAQEFMDELKTPELLRLAREYNLGVTLAHQQMTGQLSDALRAAVSTNTSIKYAAAVEGADLNYVARDLRCAPEFIAAQRRTATHANFACYVRNLTERAVSISVPLGNIDQEPQMTDDAHRCLLQTNSELLSVPKEQPALAPHQPISAAPSSPENVPSPNDSDSGAHTEAGKSW